MNTSKELVGAKRTRAIRLIHVATTVSKRALQGIYFPREHCCHINVHTHVTRDSLTLTKYAPGVDCGGLVHKYFYGGGGGWY